VRLLICAGGTGGGVYPALAVLQALKQIGELSSPLVKHQLLWVGGSDGMEVELVDRADVDFEGIQAAGVHGVGLRALPGNTLRLGRGFMQSRRILSQFRPDVMFFTGGYIAVPMALAGRSVSSLLYVPDIEPGLALKTTSRYADHVAVSTDESMEYFPGRSGITVTGYPVRPELSTTSVEIARQTLGLSEDLPTLLVFGGSKGARSINRALLSVLEDLLYEMQVVHISGKFDWDEVKTARAKISGERQERYRAFPYLHEEMGAALRAADLVISRAGASTLGEFPAFGLPAILVPYPHAWRYQRVNAAFLEERGAAIVIEDSELTDQFLPQVRALMGEQIRLDEMRQAMRRLAKPAAANHIARILLELAGESQQERM